MSASGGQSGHPLGLDECARNFLKKVNLRTTFTKYVRAQFAHKSLSDGWRQIGAFHLPGDILAVENCKIHRFSASAIVDTTVCVAKRRRLFASFAKGDIRAANNVRDLVTRTLEHVENHLLLLGRQTSLEKVAAFLLEMDHRLEHPQVMLLPMTRRGD
jgi:CRP/FNR family nitrogen fixation transcriptional regulator